MARTELARDRRLRRLFCGMVALAGVALILGASAVRTVNLPLSVYRVPNNWLFIAAFVLIIAAVPLLFASARLSLAIAAGVSTCLLIGAIFYRPPARGDQVLGRIVSGKGTVTWISENEWSDQKVQPDERYGYVGIPGYETHHYHSDFAHIMRYTFDADGWRMQPPPSAPEADIEPRPIVFLGCSVTFGYGIPDDLSYSALLAAKAWPRYRILNRALAGYGTSHAYLILEDILAGDPKPCCVFYGLIAHHLRRNYRRASHHRVVNQAFPRFELRNGNLEYLGVNDLNTALPDDAPDLANMEKALTMAMLQRMAADCQRASVPFVILLFDFLPADLRSSLDVMEGALCVDLGHFSRDCYLNEGHFTPSWHQTIAHAVCNSRAIAEYAGRNDLYQPTAIAVPRGRWVLSINRNSDARGQLRELPDGAGYRIDSIRSSSVPHDLQLIRAGLSFKAGERYRIRLQLQSKEPRSIQLTVGQAHPPWEALGLSERLDISNESYVLDKVFQATTDEPHAEVRVAFASSDQPFEISECEIRREPLSVGGSDGK